MILRSDAGNVTILDVNDVNAGTILVDPRKLTVSGAGIPRLLTNEMNQQEYNDWLKTLRDQGFSVKESDVK